MIRLCEHPVATGCESAHIVSLAPTRSTHRLLSIRTPAGYGDRLRFCRPPEECSRGIRPRQLATCLLRGKRLTSPMVSTYSRAVIGLTPAVFAEAAPFCLAELLL